MLALGRPITDVSPLGHPRRTEANRRIYLASAHAGASDFSTSSLKKGSHSITATYGGALPNTGSSVSPPYTQVVN